MGTGTQGFANQFQKPLGYQQYTSLGTAIGLSNIPATATLAVIYVEAAAIRWRDDGTAPTSSIGMPVSAGQSFAHFGFLPNLQFIQSASGAIINVSYYA